MSRELLIGTFAHTACQHDFYAQRLKVFRDAGFATATFWGGEFFKLDDLLVFDCKNGIVVAMSKMIIDLTIAGGYCYFPDCSFIY